MTNKLMVLLLGERYYAKIPTDSFRKVPDT